MFCIPITPFDGIVLEYNADGLCVPRIGVHMYAKCGAAFLHILRKTLPLQLSRDLTALSTTAKNGYEFLWHVLQHTVDMLDEQITVPRPPREDNVFRAAEAWDLYRITQIHRGQNMSRYKCSRQYLLSFNGPRLHTQATALEITLSNLRPKDARRRKEFVLPYE